MKKLFVVLMLTLALAVCVQAAGGPMISASILRYEPTPAEQGNTVDVWVQLSNAGTKADKVAIKFVPDYPFSLPPNAKSEIDVGAVAATESKVVKFTVYVDPNAPNGDQTITFLYKYNVEGWHEFEAPISVQTQNAVLVIDKFTISPSQILPGQTAQVDIVLKNMGRIGVKNVDVGFDLSTAPFSTVGTGTKKRIESIPAGASESVSFVLASDPSTEVKLYQVPVILSYQDDRNKMYNDTGKIGVRINAEPEISLIVDKTDFTSKKKPGTVSLKIINKGVVDMKYVNVRIVQTPEYNVLSTSNEQYVGNLDSDDYETVDFIIKPLVDSPRMSVVLEFKDPYNVDFKQEYNLPVRIITQSDLGKGGFPWVTVIVVVLLIAGGVYWYRRRKKRK